MKHWPAQGFYSHRYKISDMGRPKEFDPDAALARAVELFWEKGYEGASLGELTKVMGITKPSLYATYGNKEDLFRKALDYYDEHFMGFIGASLRQPTARLAIEHLLYGYVDSQTLPDHPWGCLGVHGALPNEEESSMHRELTKRQTAVRDAVRLRLEAALEDDDLAPGADAADLAVFAMVVAQGTATQARAGGTRSQLRRVVEMALQAWPFRDPQAAKTSTAKSPVANAKPRRSRA
jgi:AcrR family transcriptional regulator